MQEKAPSKGGESRATMQVQGTERSPCYGCQACSSGVVRIGWKLSCQEVGNGKLAELFKQGSTVEMNFGSGDKKDERGKKRQTDQVRGYCSGPSERW